MHLNESNGYWYLRRHTSDGKETVAKLGKQDGQPAIYRPQLIHDKAENVLRRLPDDSVDCILTDPPYGVSFESNMDTNANLETHKGSLWGDQDSDFMEELAPEFERVLKPDSHCYVFTNWKAYADFQSYFDDVLNLNTVLVWDKKMNGMGNLETWGPRHEWILHLCNGDPGLYGGRPPNVLRFGSGSTGTIPPEVQIHPTQKPRNMMEHIIKKSTTPGDVVLDPFGGAYTVARAAMRTFRQAVSCELDPEVHDLATSLVEKQLRDDPDYGIDWMDVSNLDVEQTEIVPRPVAVAPSAESG